MDNQITTREFSKQYAGLIASLRSRIEAEVDGFSSDSKAMAERIAKAKDSLEVFARTYFPHYIKHDNAELHNYLYSRLVDIVDNGTGDHDAIAAPRGNAKSTIVTQIFTIWCIVTGRKHYPVIIMDAFDQAAIMLEAIKAELEFNPRLAMDYPQATGRGRLWQVGTIITDNDVKVQVFGSGKRMRGLRHGAYRPDLAIGDDLENDENVRNPDQRDKLESWLKKTVLSLGAADDSMDVVVIGTVLHYDSLLARLLKNPLWRAKTFRAIIRWPDNMQLWDKWEDALLHDGEDLAKRFYQQNMVEMNSGAVVCWPQGQPLYTLMVKRARDGRAAFDSEQQNDPVSGDDAPFAECINNALYAELPPDLIYFGAVDPSLGKNGASRDPSALLVGGYQRNTGILYVVRADIKKRLPDRIISDVIELQRIYKCVVWSVETVQFQEFLRTELIKRSAALGVPVPARAVQPITDKLLRIETLQPHMANGLIKISPDHKTLLDQLRHFPKADHDDGPDALHMLWVTALSGSGGISYQGAGKSNRESTGGGAW
ncbi:MAG: phage terminase large subunit [Methylotenera sp.]|nr:phage terminase large subunit [Methylotenera sp.]